MDFAPTEDVAQVAELARQVFTDRADVARVQHVERELGGFDADLWQALAETGMLGIAVPEAVGGAGMGVQGMAALLEEQGRRVAPVPLWAVQACAALPLAQFGSAQQQERWLTGLIEGTHLVTGCFEQRHDGSELLSGRRQGTDLVVTGDLAQVAGAPLASAFVLPVAVEDATVLVVVPAEADGVTVTGVRATDQGAAAAVSLRDVVVPAADVLTEQQDAAEWVRTRGRVALAALAVGVTAEAIRLTAEYTSQREQFGRPLSTNQAVTVRAADAHLDSEAIRLTTQRAAWTLDEGREHEGRIASLVAKTWAARGGLRVVLATQHLHGGIGADIDYPIHRHFLFGRQIAATLGTAAATEATLGDLLESAPRIGAPA